MAPTAVAAAIRLGINSKGGTLAGGEGALEELVRERLRVKRDERPSQAALKTRLLWGVAPLVNYLGESLDAAEWESCTGTDVGDLAYELFRQVATRTRLAATYRFTLESADEWGRFCTALQRLKDGE